MADRESEVTQAERKVSQRAKKKQKKKSSVLGPVGRMSWQKHSPQRTSEPGAGGRQGCLLTFGFAQNKGRADVVPSG